MIPHLHSLRSLKSLFFLNPFLAIAAMAAFFSNSGMPLTPGFPVLQSLYAYLAATNSYIMGAVILSIGIVSLLFIRISLLVFAQEQEKTTQKNKLTITERVFFFVALLLIASAGIFPRIFLSGFEHTVNAFEFLVK